MGSVCIEIPKDSYLLFPQCSVGLVFIPFLHGYYAHPYNVPGVSFPLLARELTKPRRRRQRERQTLIGLMSKTTTLHVHHAFLYISLPSLHNYDVKWPNFKFTWERERQGDKFYHLCPNLSAFPSFNSSQNLVLLSNRANWDNREDNCEVRNDAKSLFQRRFRGRRRCRIARSLLITHSTQRVLCST